ncbi:MAG: hypothetical protein GY940_08655 [bacterium]|nr:hypothetical protein [bacterium]
MKYIINIALTMILLLTLTACGNGDGNEGTGNGGNDSPAAGTENQKKTDTGDDNDSGSGTNELTVNFVKDELHSPGAFELKKTFGFIAGMRYNGESTAKLSYVAFANYEAKLSYYHAEPPTEEGQLLIVLSFKTENKVTDFKQQMEEYVKMKVPTGTYQPVFMGKAKGFQFTYYVPNKGGPALSGDDGASGTATLTTSTANRLSGSIDFTSAKGSTFKGTFNVKVEKDLWKK